ncbi:TPA: hypothetical protein RJ691_004927 [Escherichia coli]|nr:hypothetical protein [Escherichia coli]
MYRTAIFFLMVLIVQPVFANSSTLAYSGRIGKIPYRGTLTANFPLFAYVKWKEYLRMDEVTGTIRMDNIWDHIGPGTEANCQLISTTYKTGTLQIENNSGSLVTGSNNPVSLSSSISSNGQLLLVVSPQRRNGITMRGIRYANPTQTVVAECDIHPGNLGVTSRNKKLDYINVKTPSYTATLTNANDTYKVNYSYGTSEYDLENINVVDYWFYNVYLDEGSHANPKVFVKLKPGVESIGTKNSAHTATATVKLTLKDNANEDYLQLYKNGQSVDWSDEAYPVDGDMEFSVSTNNFGKMMIPINVTVSMI